MHLLFWLLMNVARCCLNGTYFDSMTTLIALYTSCCSEGRELPNGAFDRGEICILYKYRVVFPSCLLECHAVKS